MFYAGLSTDFSTASRGKCFEAVARQGKLAADNAEARDQKLTKENSYLDYEKRLKQNFRSAYPAIIRG
jgi:hypothetical protein